MKYGQFIFILMLGAALGMANAYAGTAGNAGVANACGTGCSYTISEDGKTLTITGTGTGATVNQMAFSPNYDSRGYYVFGNKKDTRFDGIENVVVTGTISSIERSAFYNNNITSVTIPDFVKTIGNSAFSGAGNLININLSGVETIENNAFYGTNLTSVDLTGVKTIGDTVFYGVAGLKDVLLPDSYFSENDDSGISEWAFLGSNIEKIYCPEGQNCTGRFVKACQEGYYYDGDGCYSDDDDDYANPVYFSQESIISYKIENNQFNVGGKTYASMADLAAGNHIPKRIYTVDEANAVAGKTNIFSIRYR